MPRLRQYLFADGLEFAPGNVRHVINAITCILQIIRSVTCYSHAGIKRYSVEFVVIGTPADLRLIVVCCIDSLCIQICKCIRISLYQHGNGCILHQQNIRQLTVISRSCNSGDLCANIFKRHNRNVQGYIISQIVIHINACLQKIFIR